MNMKSNLITMLYIDNEKMNDKEKINNYNQNPYYPDARRILSNSNWVCVNCRIVIRHSKGNSYIPKCTKCSDETLYFGDKFEAPKKDDKKSWSKLKKLIDERKKNDI